MVTKNIVTFFQQYIHKGYKKGEQLKKFREEAEGVFYLKKGVVRLAQPTETGLATINIYKQNAFFPVQWAINNTSDPYIYEAMTDVDVYVAPKTAVKKFLKENPDVVYDLLKRIYKGLEGYFLLMGSLLSGDAYKRLILQLIINTKRLGRLQKNGTYELDLTHQQFAALSGLSRETVTREMQKLIEKKLVSYKGKQLVINDLEKLESQLV